MGTKEIDAPETNTLIESSRSIMEQAVEKYKPYATVVMLSGGDDSVTAYHVARELGVEYDFVLHIRTGTGIPETGEYVERLVKGYGDRLVIADAGTAYEDYVLRKGFFGMGRTGHNYAYHLLKAGPYRKAISKKIRKRKHNRPVLLLNGARKNESSNRTVKLDGWSNRDPAARNNIWISLLYEWSKQDCTAYLRDRGIERNPVSIALHRSAECMCGTMQSMEDRHLAAALYPEWGKWLNDLEKRSIFPWKWGESTTKAKMDKYKEELQLMCMHCTETDATTR